MSVPALLNHPSVQKTFDMIKMVGGRVEIDGNKVTVFSGILPRSLASAFVERIKRFDTQDILEVNVGHEE